MIHNEKVWSFQIKTMDLIHTLTFFQNPTKEMVQQFKKNNNFSRKRTRRNDNHNKILEEWSSIQQTSKNLIPKTAVEKAKM